MAYSLIQLYERRNDEILRKMIAAACWRYAKILLSKPSPTIEEMKLAEKFLSDEGCGKEIGKFNIAVAVLLDDGVIDDSSVETAVLQIATKFLSMQT